MGEFVFAKGYCRQRPHPDGRAIEAECEVDSLDVTTPGSPAKVVPCPAKLFEITCPQGGALFHADVVGHSSIRSVVTCEKPGTQFSSYQGNTVPPHTIQVACLKDPKPVMIIP